MGAIAFDLACRTGVSRAFIASASLDRFPALVENVERILHPRERDYFERLVYDKRRTSFLVGRYAAKHALSAYLGGARPEAIDIQPGFFGHPIVSCASPERPAMSLSHDGVRAVAVAFSEEFLIGVDVETVDARNQGAIASVLTAGEAGWASAGPFPPETMRTVVWTAREALAKAIRCGCLVDSAALEVCAPDVQLDGETLVSVFAHFPAMCCESWALDGEVVSVVTPKDVRTGLTAAVVASAVVAGDGAVDAFRDL